MARPRYPELNRQLLERERRRQGLTLADLARRCHERGDKNVDETALSRYERGEVRPGPNRLLILAQALGVTVDDLLAEEIAA
jgi:transcriptional regulator with XRE-family HTH domain